MKLEVRTTGRRTPKALVPTGWFYIERFRHQRAMQTKAKACTHPGPVGQKGSPVLLFVAGAIIIACLTAFTLLGPFSHLEDKHRIMIPTAQKQ